MHRGHFDDEREEIVNERVAGTVHKHAPWQIGNGFELHSRKVDGRARSGWHGDPLGMDTWDREKVRVNAQCHGDTVGHWAGGIETGGKVGQGHLGMGRPLPPPPPPVCISNVCATALLTRSY